MFGGGRFMVVFYFRTVSRPFLAKCKVEKSRFHLRNKSQNWVCVLVEITNECHQLSQIKYYQIVTISIYLS